MGNREIGIRILVFLLVWPLTEVFGQKELHRTFRSGGKPRAYILYLPEDLPADAPLLFVMHGYTGTAEGIMTETGFNQLADRERFAVCYPQGLRDTSGNTYWEVGYDFTQSIRNNDLNFLNGLAIELQVRYGFSRYHTFATGMSNGADMCIALAMDSRRVFKAVAPVCGSLMKKTMDQSRKAPPLPVMLINSTADSITWWEGDMANRQGYGPYLPVKTMVKLLADRNGCSTAKTDSLPDLNPSDGSYVVRERYIDCNGVNPVWFYQVVGGGHDWPGVSGNKDLNATEAVWAFFKLWIQRGQ